MYGWRARIALLIAHSNTTMEPEFNRLAPAGVSIHTARVRIPQFDIDGLMAMGGDLGRGVADLAEIDAAVFAFACTSATFVGGTDYDVLLARQIEEQTGRPAISAMRAVLEALAALEARRIVVATPYPKEVNESQERFLAANGLDVLYLGGVNFGGPRLRHDPLAASPVSHVGLQPPEVAYRLARAAYRAGAEAVVISGANLRTIEIVAALEADLGVPVVTSSQATIWAALQLAGVRDSIPGYGRLLEGPIPLRRAQTQDGVAADSVSAGPAAH